MSRPINTSMKKLPIPLTIDEHTQERKALLKRWKRNRDHTSGADTVKEAGVRYLPKMANMDANAYRSHLLMTEYFPASARTLQSLIGLAFRKSATLIAPTRLKKFEWIMTAEGRSLEDVARWAVNEFAITNDGGILVDHPVTPDGMNLAEAERQGIRPYMAYYTAESILEHRFGVVGGRRVPVYVRLKETREDEEIVRVLELVDGKYTVTVHKLIAGPGWVKEPSFEPSIGIGKEKKPLDYIPFTILTVRDDLGALFDDMCNLNETHYATSALLSSAIRWISAPVRVVTGCDEDAELSAHPGAIWRFESDRTRVEFNEYKGDGVPAVERQLDRYELHMSMLGSRMLTSEKAAAEAAETVARRQSAENSIWASVLKHISLRLEKPLEHMALWLGEKPDKLNYVISTDFIPSIPDSQIIGAMDKLNTGGKVSDRELFDYMQRIELISEAITYEAHRAEVEAQVVDQPVIDGAVTDTDTDDGIGS